MYVCVYMWVCVVSRYRPAYKRYKRTRDIIGCSLRSSSREHRVIIADPRYIQYEADRQAPSRNRNDQYKGV